MTALYDVCLAVLLLVALPAPLVIVAECRRTWRERRG